MRSAEDPCTGLVAEGVRLQLSPSVDCAARTVPFPDPGGFDTRFLREVCRALQVYGMIIVDGSGDPGLYSLFMEQGTDSGGTANWDAVLNRPPDGLWGNIVRDVNASATGDGVARNATTGIPWIRCGCCGRAPTRHREPHGLAALDHAPVAPATSGDVRRRPTGGDGGGGRGGGSVVAITMSSPARIHSRRSSLPCRNRLPNR